MMAEPWRDKRVIGDCTLYLGDCLEVMPALESVETCLKILRQLRIEDLTGDEVAATCGIVLNTARARISNMKDFGYVATTGRKRATEAGKDADVYTITDAGRSYLAQYTRRTA